jgi:hypothetical protein
MLSGEERRRLAGLLGDAPETTIAVDRLLTGRCRAHAEGSQVIVQDDDCPAEPLAFGEDPSVIRELLRRVEGWSCVNVPLAMAEPLRESLVRELGTPVRIVEDIYHTLTTPANETGFARPEVRLLGASDLGLLQGAPAELQPSGFGSLEASLREGFVAGAAIEGRLVAIAHTYALTERHADIGVSTLLEWRDRGLSTAAAALVAAAVQAEGRTPVWSTATGNTPSHRVAEKLGFREVGRRAYLIPTDR